MSILIRGMKMPKNCETCEYQTKGACFALGVNKGTITIRRMGKERPDWCPLIEIPEKHGRLIDGDVLSFNLDGMMAVSPTGYIHGDTVADMIGDAPTIIEAEGDEE